MRPDGSRRLLLGGWLVAVAAATAVLHAAGSGALAPPPVGEPGAWGAWVSERDPVTAALALCRLGALVVAWYLLTASVVGTAVRLVHARRLTAAVDVFTVPALRRLLVAAAGLSMASGMSPVLALASTPHPPAAVAGPTHHQVTAAGQPLPTTTTTTTVPTGPPPTLTMRPLARGETVAPAPAAPGASFAQPAPATSWTVHPGECFWSIAEDVLTRAWSRPPTDAEIVPYWRTLIEANRGVLADPSNPDLLFPGQVFTVPAL